MNSRLAPACCAVVGGLMVVVMLLGAGQAPAQVAGASPGEATGVEVLARGPLHEAFAEIVVFNPRPGLVVPKPPPAAIQEEPPAERPAGENVEWIPGYWAWDRDRSGYIWVSGVWRDVPPDRQWIPGYWTETEDGDQWVPGYWADANQEAVDYLPEPPAIEQAGPSEPAPSPDDIWVPGYWEWRSDRYIWQAGYWEPAHADWVWVSAHYNWTPRGYVFVDGYWDYPLRERGIDFAPVAFESPVYLQPGFVFTPSFAIDIGIALDNLFVRTHDYHYYFGDYYAPDYQEAGFYPEFLFHNRRGYDPIFAHQRWAHRADRDWEHRLQERYESRQKREAELPADKLAELFRHGEAPAAAREAVGPIVARLSELAQNTKAPLRLERVPREERAQLAQRTPALQQFREQRRRTETRSPAVAMHTPVREVNPRQAREPRPTPRTEARPTPQPEAKPAPAKPAVRPESAKPEVRPAPAKPEARPAPAKPERERLPRSPIVAKPARQRSKLPPKPHVPPKPSKPEAEKPPAGR